MTYIPGGGGSVPYWVTKHPLTPPTSPNAKDEEWNDGTGMSGPVNGLDASWTAFGSAQTRAYANGCLILTGTAPGSPSFSGLFKTAPVTPYTVTCPVRLATLRTFDMLSIGFRQSSSGKLWLWTLQNATDNSWEPAVVVQRYASPTSRTSFTTSRNTRSPLVWLQITNNGTNLSAKVAVDGVQYYTEVTETIATFFTGSPDQVVIGVDAFSANSPVGVFGPVRFS